MRRLLPLLALALPVLAAGYPVGAAPAPAPTGLMCELLAEPERTEILDPRPELTWIVSPEQGLQTAYQVRVAATPEALAAGRELVWDSGQVRSDRSVAVEYGGKPLESRHGYAWHVRAWGKGGPSEWSEPQRFRTGDLAVPEKPGDRFTTPRYPLVQEEAFVRQVLIDGVERTFFDFGTDAYASLQLTFDSLQAGRVVVVHLGEALEAPTRVNRKPPGSVRYQRVELTLDKGMHTYDVPLPARDARRMPPEVGAVMPFRYVEVENAPHQLTAGHAKRRVVHYPFRGDAARFLCTDRRLNDVWELCRYSMKATSFCGVYVDGDRERLPYEADAYINQLGHYACDREFTLARYSHEYLIQHPTWPTEWSLHSVLMAWADYLYTGDRESLAQFYGDLKGKTLSALAREDGLISTVQPPVTKPFLAEMRLTRMQDIVDWPAGERDGYEMKPVNTVVNAFHYRALVLMGKIAAALDRSADAAEYRKRAERVARAIQAKLFDAKTGLYVDGEGSSHSSLHANMFPLAFGLVPPERVAGVGQFVAGKGMACSVYGAQYLMEALYAAGQAQRARELMVAPGDRSWRHMVEAGTTITWEAWDQKYKPNQDWNHAWGAAPANLLPRFLMGVEPLEPGFRKVRVRPQPGGLGGAVLDLLTVRGPIHAEFRSRPEQFALGVSLPGNTMAEVHLPRLGEGTAVTLDGKPQKAKAQGEFLVVDGVGPGTHQVVVTRKK